MNAVREFVFSIMIVSVVAAAINMLAPDNSSVSRYVHFISALAVTAILLSPIRDVVSLIPKITDADLDMQIFFEGDSAYVYADEIINEACSHLNEEIKADIEERFACEIVSVKVSCDSEDIENVIITSVEVEVKKANRFICSDIINYIEDLLECECEVVESKDV